jgi:hypothetical protein
MAQVPPKALETIVGLFIPPACREEVLGDLSETYTGPAGYVLLALRVVPFVIVSRIRRTTDAYVLLTEALLIYGSYLVATWYTDRAVLAGPGGFWRLAIPTVLNVADLAVIHAWAGENRRLPMILVQAFVLEVSICVNVYGYGASVVLVSALEIMFGPQGNLPQVAKQPEVSATTKGLLAAGAAILLVAIAVNLGLKPGTAGLFVVVALVFWMQLRGARKE